MPTPLPIALDKHGMAPHELLGERVSYRCRQLGGRREGVIYLVHLSLDAAPRINIRDAIEPGNCSPSMSCRDQSIHLLGTPEQ